jgi:hypothetical protein
LSEKSYLKSKIDLLSSEEEAPIKKDEALCLIFQQGVDSLETISQLAFPRLKRERNKENH